MSTTFRTRAGDTFEGIARRVYGTEAEAARIRNANPGVVEPLQAGVDLLTPPDPLAPVSEPQSVVPASDDEVAVHLDNQRFRFWTEATLTRSIDDVSVLSLRAPFRAADPRFREALRPFSFKPVTMTIGGAREFTGTMLNPVPVVNANERVVQISAYSTPGVLMDCTAPASAYPIQFSSGQTAKDMAEQLAGYFGIPVQFDSPVGAPLSFGDYMTLEEGKKIWPYLAEFARTRNLLMRDGPKGELIFHTPPAPSKVVARLEQGASPLVDVMPVFDSQNYYSHVTGKPAYSFFSTGDPYTVRNPSLKGVMRPYTFKIADTYASASKAATDSKAGRMLASAASFPVQLATMRDPQGDLWRPGTYVSLVAPDATVYNPYTFLVRSVSLTRTKKSGTASMELVIPESFRGEIPEVMPWDE